MFKKIILIGLFVGLIGFLLVGAVNRTVAKNEGEGNGSRGRGVASITDDEPSTSAGVTTEEFQGNGGNGWGRGGQGSSSEDGSLSNGSEAYTTGAGKNGGYGQGRGEEIGDHEFMPAIQGDLNEAEKEALIFMREEEKLAHDVYLVMYDLWGLPIFLNISSSEQSHTEAVKALLDGYDVPDPVSDARGVFTNPDLQALYNELVAQGSQSLSDALLVGAVIEEIDILDLQERLAQTDNADIQHVFTNLLKGSSNHLRAFTSTLMTQTGETYQPQFMSMDAYQTIIGESGIGNGQGRGTRDGRGGRP
ncbi:MAG: DUF2202 domain-containing protein [Anaerolineales bacterium]|jgi:hypothetical protein